MIRTLLIASLATLAATEAEPKADADPYLVYGGYPYSYGHLPYYTHPVVTKKVVKAVDGEEEKAVVPLTLPYGGLYNYGYGYTGYPVVKSVVGKSVIPTVHHNWGYYGKSVIPTVHHNW